MRTILDFLLGQVVLNKSRMRVQIRICTDRHVFLLTDTFFYQMGHVTIPVWTNDPPFLHTDDVNWMESSIKKISFLLHATYLITMVIKYVP